jgi:hypothetical protein
MRALFYSKLSILELCGWIEESMDNIIRCCGNRNLKDRTNRQLVEKGIIKRTYGFEYNRHFRKMLIQVVGLIAFERLERRMDSSKLQLMKSALGSLRTLRDTEAHTHLKGVTRRLDAPSVTKARFFDVYHGLREVETGLRKMKL